MDLTDRKILDALVKDSDVPRRDVARQVQISEGSLSKRISALKEEGLIREFSLNIDYDKAGFHTNAFTLLRLKEQERDSSVRVVQRLAKLDEVIEVYSIFGEWDIYVRWLCRNNAHLMDVLKDVLSQDIAQAQTVTLGQEHKRSRGPHLVPNEKSVLLERS